MFVSMLAISSVWCLLISGSLFYVSGSVGVGFFSFLFLAGAFLFSAIKYWQLSTVVVKAEKGWRIEEAAEISNPESPVKGAAVLDSESILLGLLAVGGPGSGKSVTVVSLIQYLAKAFVDWGMSYFDGKGDFDIYQMYCYSAGKPDYFFSSELPGSDTINVCDAPVETLIDMFSRVFVGGGSEYYGPAQKKALRSSIPLLASFGVPFNLPDLWIFLTNEQAAKDTIAKAKKEGIDEDVIAAAEQYFNDSDPDKRLNIIDGLLNKLHPFVVGDISKKINAYSPSLDIDTAVSSGEKIYFHLPLTDISLDTATMITEKLGVIAKNRQLDAKNKRTPFPLFFDDWGKFMYSNFGPITARCRSAKMPCSFFFQSRGQTDAVEIGGVFTTEITDNIGGMVSLRINGMETAEWMARQFGTYESSQLVSRTDDGTQTVSVTDKPRVKAQEIMDMSKGEAFVRIFENGEAGAMANRLYNLRFPMPTEDFEKPEDWPVMPDIVPNDESAGLHLWRDYRRPQDVVARKKEAVKAAIEEDISDISQDDDEGLFL